MAPTAATVPPASGMPAPPPLEGELDALLRRLRLPHIRRAAPEVLATARAQRWEPAEVLRTLLAAEATGRERSSRATRRASAGFPTGKTFAAWDEQASSIPPPTQAALRTLEWVHRRENLVVCGPSGTGKTFFLEALGQTAVEAGSKVAWFSLESLGALVRRHRADDSVTKAVTRILRADLVVVDDIGLLPVGPDAARGALPAGRRRLRAAQRGGQLQPPPGRLRRAHAQDPGHRDRGPTAPPRPPMRHPRRLGPAQPGHLRQGGGATDLTLPGRPDGHQWGTLMAITGEDS
jgi:IstB-like ATP binding protein